VKKLFLVPLVIVLVSGLIFGGCAAPAPAPAPSPAPAPAPSPTPAPEKTWEVKFAPWLSPTQRSSQIVHTPYVMQIEEASNGRVKVVEFPGAAIAKANEIWEALESGLADIGYIAASSLYPGRIPLTSLISLPLSGATTAVASGRAMTDVFNKWPEIQEEFSGIKVLCLFAPPAQGVHSVDRPIRRLEDLKGLKLRSGAEVCSPDFFEAAGAIPVTMPPHDLYLSLERGVLDSVQYGVSSITGFRLEELLKYHTMVPFKQPVFIYAMNQDKWDSFPPDIQEAIMKKMGAYAGADYIDALLDVNTEEVLKYLESEVGNEIIYLSPEEIARWKDLIEPLWAEEIAKVEAMGLPAQEVFDDYMRLIKKREAE